MEISITDLNQKPHSTVVCYPKVDNSELAGRIVELRSLSIDSLVFQGEKKIDSIRVLGKGCVGIVVLAMQNGKQIALKIRRADADREKMQAEASMLKAANSVFVGPQFLGVSDNFLLMELIDGKPLPIWLEEKRERNQVKSILLDLLQQCRRLDRIGLDHGELSHAPKHLIVRKNQGVIIDFESASLNRRPANVTSICQFLFISRFLGLIVQEKIRRKLNLNALLSGLAAYKKQRTDGNFNEVLKLCYLYDVGKM